MKSSDGDDCGGCGESMTSFKCKNGYCPLCCEINCGCTLSGKNKIVYRVLLNGPKSPNGTAWIDWDKKNLKKYGPIGVGLLADRYRSPVLDVCTGILIFPVGHPQYNRKADN